MSELNQREKAELCQTAIQAFGRVGSGLRNFPRLLKRIIDERAWESREFSGRTIKLESLRQLITLKPVDGWGEDPAKIEAVIRDEPEVLAAFREAMLGKPGRPKADEKTDNNIIELDRSAVGTSRAYSIAVVQRECDADTVAAVMAGEMSPNAALVKAGLRENRQVYLPRDPVAAARKIREKFGDEFFNAILEANHGG